MSVLIKGMAMPENCEECALWDIDHACCRVPSVPWIDYFFGETRLDDCPLVEVPPHGRLIDGDMLESLIYERISDLDYKADAFDILRIVQDMPTIIEAEEGEGE